MSKLTCYLFPVGIIVVASYKKAINLLEIIYDKVLKLLDIADLTF